MTLFPPLKIWTQQRSGHDSKIAACRAKIRKSERKSEARLSHCSCQQCTLLRRQSLLPGGLPDCKAEPDLVHEISHVVDEIQRSIIHCAEKVAEEVSQRVDGPANGDNEAHDVEGGLDGLGGTLSALGTLTGAV